MRNTANANRTISISFLLTNRCLNAQEEGIPLWDRDVKRYIY